MRIVLSIGFDCKKADLTSIVFKSNFSLAVIDKNILNDSLLAVGASACGFHFLEILSQQVLLLFCHLFV